MSACLWDFETAPGYGSVLAYPTDEGYYVLDTDASNYAMGAVLSQVQNGEERVIAYASQTLSHTQQNYCTTKKELLAVVTFVEHFRYYLYGRPFTIRTDHASLRWLRNFKTADGMLAHWLTKLERYNYTFVHRKGSQMLTLCLESPLESVQGLIVLNVLVMCAPSVQQVLQKVPIWSQIKMSGWKSGLWRSYKTGSGQTLQLVRLLNG